MAASDLLSSRTMVPGPGGGGPSGGTVPPVKPPVTHPRRGFPPVPSTRTQVQTTVATQLAASPNPLNPWQPWTGTIQQAEARARQQITAALAQFNHAAAAAGQLLDTASAIARQAAGRLEDLARAEYEKYMKQAADVDAQIMDPAQAIYDQAMTEAATEFNEAFDSITDSFSQAMVAAQHTRDLAGKFPAA